MAWSVGPEWPVRLEKDAREMRIEKEVIELLSEAKFKILGET
jgi:hypothetical protein